MTIDPSWKRRPDVPGLYLCVGTGPINGALNGLQLTQDEIDLGCPFYTSWVYGPIPERTHDEPSVTRDTQPRPARD